MRKEEVKFSKGDYIINRNAHDMAVFDRIDQKGYIHFKYYRWGMSGMFADVSNHTLLMNYHTFYEPMTDEEKKAFDKLIKVYEKEGNNMRWSMTPEERLEYEQYMEEKSTKKSKKSAGRKTKKKE